MQLYRQVTANQVILTEMPFKRELSMQAYLMENEKILALDNDDFSTVNVLDMELPVSRGRPSKARDGRIDLIVEYGASTIGVIELKRGELNGSHLAQLEDYLSDTAQLEVLVRDPSTSDQVSFIGLLVGESIQGELREKIQSGYLSNDTVPIAALTLRRYQGRDGNIYVITDTYFHNASPRADRTKYRFNGVLVGKGRLVLAVLKQHVEVNPELTYAGLEADFPKRLQGALGCFGSVEEAQRIFDRTERNRHFRSPEDLIELKDTYIAVCNQWGIGNIGAFIGQASQLGYRISKE